MEIIKVRASLKLALIDDIYCGKSTYEGKVLFLKCPFSQQFEGIYRVPKIESYFGKSFLPKEIHEMNEASATFDQKEILVGLTNKQFYTFSEGNSSLDFQFKLLLKKADDFDFFDGPRFLKQNIYYYQKINSHEISGPLLTDASSEVIKFKNELEKGNLFVIHNKQNFEPFKNALAS